MLSNIHAKARALLISFLSQSCPLKTVSGGQLQLGEPGAVQLLFPGEAWQYAMYFKNGFPSMESNNQRQILGRHEKTGLREHVSGCAPESQGRKTKCQQRLAGNPGKGDI